MTTSHKVLGFLFVVGLGLYGCTKAPGPSENRSSVTEIKLQRLEEDFRAAATARDSFRMRMLAAEEQKETLQKQLDQTVEASNRERETSRSELRTRTIERDNLQSQYEVFRKNIREVLGQAEASLNSTPSTASQPVVVGNSGSSGTLPSRN